MSSVSIPKISVQQLTKDWKLFANLTSTYKVTLKEEEASFVIVDKRTEHRQKIYFLESVDGKRHYVLKIISDSRVPSEDEILKEVKEECGPYVIEVEKVTLHRADSCIKFILMPKGIDLNHFITENNLNALKGGKLGKEMKNLMYHMTKSVKLLHGAGFHHRDIRTENFVVAKLKDELEHQLSVEGKSYLPQIIDFGLSRKIGHESLVNHQDFTRPPNYVYLHHSNTQDELAYQDCDEIYALAMTFLELLGMTPDLTKTIPNCYLFSIDSTFRKEESQVEGGDLKFLLSLRPSLQAFRLVMYFGWPPESFKQFYLSPMGVTLKKFDLEDISTWNYFNTYCCRYLSGDPLLFKMLESMLKWNRSERVQSFENLFNEYLLPWMQAE